MNTAGGPAEADGQPADEVREQDREQRALQRPREAVSRLAEPNAHNGVCLSEAMPACRDWLPSCRSSPPRSLVVVQASSEFLPGTSVNPSSVDFVEVGRTDVAVDDASPTFALPVRVTCRAGMDRLVRMQLLWSQSGMLGGSETVLGESVGPSSTSCSSQPVVMTLSRQLTHAASLAPCVLTGAGQAVERFSDLQAKTANLQPLVFSMSLATACPRGRCLIWRVPMQSLHPPASPYMCLASKRHVSFSVPYVFRKAGQGSDGSKAPRRTSKTPTDDGGALLAGESVRYGSG